MNQDELIAEVTSAHRQRAPDGSIRSHPAWHDLDAAGREEAFALTAQLRRMEAALSPLQRSSTVQSVLARIRNAR